MIISTHICKESNTLKKQIQLRWLFIFCHLSYADKYVKRSYTKNLCLCSIISLSFNCLLQSFIEMQLILQA